MKKNVVIAIVVGVAVIAGGLFFSGVFSKKEATETTQKEPEKVFALYGYDPVAYYKIGYATKGKEEFETSFDGVLWLFANAEHKELFLANPEKYLPQYGGFCSIAMAYGIVKPSDPKLWHIHEGKLYMNGSIDAHLKWRYDLENNIRKADLSWYKIVQKRKEQKERAEVMQKNEEPKEINVEEKDLEKELEKDIK